MCSYFFTKEILFILPFDTQSDIKQAFNHMSRYLGDICVIDINCSNMVQNIYPNTFLTFSQISYNIRRMSTDVCRCFTKSYSDCIDLAQTKCLVIGDSC